MLRSGEAHRSSKSSSAGVLLLLAALAFSPAALAKTASPPTSKPRPSAARVAAARDRYRYRPARFAGKAGRYYRVVWGVDSLDVKLLEQGELVRFSWRVLDPRRAALLSDKRLEPALFDPRARVSLVVPAMEKVGQLRQSAPPEAGKSYWMTFSNKGRLVKRGDRVGIVIGEFRAEGLVVD